MKDTYAGAKLVEPDLIRFVSLSDASFPADSFYLLIDRTKKEKILPTKNVSTPSHYFFEFRLSKPLELGHSYFIYIPSCGICPLNVNEATTFSNFDNDYFYDGELGSLYSKDKTTWKLWAPLASKVVLSLKKGDYYLNYEMTRGDKGVYSLALEGDFNLQEYHYLVTNNEVEALSIDPYAKGSLANAEESVVIDNSSLQKDFFKDKLPKMNSKTDAIIYEGNVRDLTIDKHSTIKNKGKYPGLIEENAKTADGNPFGLDYLKFLGFTHLQLQPLNDFGSVDEKQGFKDYNWGYDPTQYFVPEGSYSLDPTNPLKRIEELQKMVQELHKAGIRVVLDVVFNHVYDYICTSFEKTAPNYYFRKLKTGQMTNSSGCGNDLNSERPMVRKLIKDACRWWRRFYGIDGFRFDLMGLIDSKTILEVQKEALEEDRNFIIYGEGWNMFAPTSETMSNLNNAKALPSLGFFNDSFRENVKSYCAGDLSKKDSFKYSLIGSCHPWGYRDGMFLDASQSINYIECHDNGTYYDFLDKYFNYSDLDKMEIIKFSLASVIFSFGLPFIHMGEEIGQSKFMKENTYNLGDIYNKLSDKLLDERFEMAQYCRGAILLRKHLDIYKESNPAHLAKMIDFEDFGDGLLMKVYDKSKSSDLKEVDFLFNPTSDALTYSFKEDRLIIFTSGGLALGSNILGKSVLIPKHSLLITALKK